MSVPHSLYVDLINRTANMSECLREGMINTATPRLHALNTCGNWIQTVVYGFYGGALIYLRLYTSDVPGSTKPG